MMSASVVWVELRIKGREEEDPIQVYQSDLKAGRDWNIASLKEAVQAKLPGIALSKIRVYPAGTLKTRLLRHGIPYPPIHRDRNP